ncbi:SGNH/GDSL hydrolase family protein [Mycoplasmopsis cynos]|uniref:SGNH/GDSL hydrolase family protein n=1 Tax=Mycoplasmopsis cynos TaxID=171284 RepID=UPI0024C6831F|nr:SGNH/GDSL hydrolase family protein [Mycoplasmopsis cynos]WAM05238.1 GDSL-type esterase/lipase family protein [Mycoplasmopsis cynos]
MDKDYQGKLENNGIISGVSYPSFLARLLNKKNRVKSYTNYSVSYSKIIDWIKLLEFNDPEIKNVDESTFNKLFPNVQQLRTELKQNLAKANLVTINLGANDFFNLVFDSLKNRDVLKIVKKFLAKKPVLNDAIIFFNDLFKDSFAQIRKRLTVFINNLKTLAPNANINLISYPTPLQYLFNVLNQYVSKDLLKDIGDLNISNIFIDTVNDNLQEVFTNTKINFVNTYNDKYWNNNAKNLTSFFLDIHPGTKFYKKMALDLYLKITKPIFKS